MIIELQISYCLIQPEFIPFNASKLYQTTIKCLNANINKMSVIYLFHLIVFYLIKVFFFLTILCKQKWVFIASMVRFDFRRCSS